MKQIHIFIYSKEELQVEKYKQKSLKVFCLFFPLASDRDSIQIDYHQKLCIQTRRRNRDKSTLAQA